MLSDEEKKAIDILKNSIADYVIDSYCKECIDFPICDEKNEDCYFIDAIDTVINLIKKQSKEIEELKEDKLELINKNHVVHLKDVEKELREMRKVIDTKNAEIECLNVIHESYKEMVEENNFISKDKLKAKIEELEKDNLYDCYKLEIKVLQSLLEKE